MTKSQQRDLLRQQRDAMAKAEAEKKSEKICSKLKELDRFQRVMVYLPFGRECDISAYTTWLLENQREVYVPVCVGKGIMKASRLLDREKDLEIADFGILAPKKEAWRFIDPEALDAVIVPGVAFDKHGARLGFGGGFYDRFLPKTRKDCQKIAVCYEFQLVNDVDPEAHDFPVMHIITEEAVYDIIQM